MASSLSITTQLNSDNKFEVTCSVVPGGTLPQDVFVYTNTGTNVLGDYIGICDLKEYQRLQTFSGNQIPQFGNKFVKYTEGRVVLDSLDDIPKVTQHFTNTATFLSFEMSNASSVTKIIPIP